MISLNDVALEITAHCKTITNFLTAQNLSHPSFAVDGPIGLPSGPENEKLQEARIALVDAAAAIHHLAIGPDDWIKWQALTVRLYFLLRLFHSLYPAHLFPFWSISFPYDCVISDDFAITANSQ